MDDSVKELDRRNINLKMYEIFNKKLDDFENRYQSLILSILVGLGIIIGYFIQNFNQITTLTIDIGSSYIIFILISAAAIIILFLLYFFIRFKYYKNNIEVINGHLRSLEIAGNLFCTNMIDINKWEKNFEKQMHLREKKTIDYSFLIAGISSLVIIGIIIFSVSRLSNADLQKAIKENKAKTIKINELETELKKLNQQLDSLIRPVTPITPVTPIKP